MQVFLRLFLFLVLLATYAGAAVSAAEDNLRLRSVSGTVLPLQFDDQGAESSLRRIAVRTEPGGTLSELLISRDEPVSAGDVIHATGSTTKRGALRAHALSITAHAHRHDSNETIARCLPFEGGSEPVRARATVNDGAAHSLAAIPQLSSLPQATRHIYLDFDGHPAEQWGDYSAAETPAYSQDGDSSTFTATELAGIAEVWTQVAEKYSPFNINVTTIDPGDFSDGRALRLVIGGNGAWLGGVSGGVSYIGSFYNGTPNVSWVFEDNLANGAPRYVADAAAHEAGHAFGLRHQSEGDINGSCRYSYAAGTADKSPIMGFPYVSARSIWWTGVAGVGTNTGCTIIGQQSDFEALLSTANSFGLRPDDHDGLAAPRAIETTAQGFVAGGVIEHPGDSDCFAFDAPAGGVRASTESHFPGKMLDSAISFYNADGSLHAATAPGPEIGTALSTNVGAGRYTVCVASAGLYGDLGGYALEVTFGETIPSPNIGDRRPPPLGVTIFPSGTGSKISRKARRISVNLSYQGTPAEVALRVNGRTVTRTSAIKDQYSIPVRAAAMRLRSIKVTAAVWDEEGNTAASGMKFTVVAPRRRAH